MLMLWLLLAPPSLAAAVKNFESLKRGKEKSNNFSQIIARHEGFNLQDIIY